MNDPYSASSWYWFVAGDHAQVYSSATGDYVPVTDAAYIAWTTRGNRPTSIASSDELADVLAAASARPTNADVLDRYKGAQSNRLTLEVAAKVLFNQENRLRVIEGKPTVTAAQFGSALKAIL